MGEIFNQDYYHVGNEDQKPEFPYDPDIDDGNLSNGFIGYHLFILKVLLS